MANTQHIHKLLFLLVITACLEIQFTEGRQLKAMNEHDLSPVRIETGLKYHAKQSTKVERSLRDQKDHPHVTQQKKAPPPIKPTQSDELSSSDVSRKDTSEPTTQGNSPGIGHSFPGQTPNMQPKVKDLRVTAGKTDAFQFTTQGHSPGIGHSFGN